VRIRARIRVRIRARLRVRIRARVRVRVKVRFRVSSFKLNNPERENVVKRMLGLRLELGARVKG
jgi:hypothetical protein